MFPEFLDSFQQSVVFVLKHSPTLQCTPPFLFLLLFFISGTDASNGGSCNNNLFAPIPYSKRQSHILGLQGSVNILGAVFCMEGGGGCGGGR